MIIQFTVIYYLNVTGDLLFPVAGSSQTKTYFLPIIALSLIPAFMIYRINLHLVNEEWDKSYVELARSKGTQQNVYFL
jgi:peptide/nickel transport system permease protein